LADVKPISNTPSSTPKESTRTKTTFNLQNIGKATPKPAEEKKTDEPKIATSTPVFDKPIDMDSLKKVWNEFAELKKNNVAEYQLLKRGFTIQDSKITITLNNAIEEPFLAGIRTSLIAYLRDKLSNRSILVNGVLPEFTESRPMIYTNKEKFDYLVSKNPALKDLQERFGLDADY
jgi:hypothetical protein